MNDSPKESDWKAYKKLIDPAYERFLQKKNQEMVHILSDPGRTSADRFEDVQKEIKATNLILRDCFGRFSRSSMQTSLVLMCRYGLLDRDDLTPFSPELQENLNLALELAS